MSKRALKKEIKRLNKIIDVLLKENRGVFIVSHAEPKTAPETTENLSATTNSVEYIGGRPGDRL